MGPFLTGMFGVGSAWLTILPTQALFTQVLSTWALSTRMGACFGHAFGFRLHADSSLSPNTDLSYDPDSALTLH